MTMLEIQDNVLLFSIATDQLFTACVVEWGCCCGQSSSEIQDSSMSASLEAAVVFIVFLV